MFDKIQLKELVKSFKNGDVFKYTILNSYEFKKTKKKINELVQKYHINQSNHEYDRALGNAYHHGEFPIKCKIYFNKCYQMLCVVKDKGHGFDYREVVNKFSRNEIYFHYHGAGTRSYAKNNNLLVDWKNHGRMIILFYK